MRHLPLSELRRDLPTWADSVLNTGEGIIVTRHGKPIAKLVPCGAEDVGGPPLALRGMPLVVAEDFDAPLDAGWEALS